MAAATVSRPQFVWALAVFVLMVGLPAFASASGGSAAEAVARAQPRASPPGAPVTLTFTVPSLGLVDADVNDIVTCTIRAPDGTTSPCGNSANLIAVDVSPAARSYSYDAQAPKAAGNYTIHFERHSTLSLPSSDASADTTLSVMEQPLASSGDPTGVIATTPGSILPTNLGSGDGQRWLASLAMGTAAMVAGVAVVRTGGRP